MLVLVLRMLRYCRMSGNVISRRALRNLRPIQVLTKQIRTNRKDFSCRYDILWYLFFFHSLICVKLYVDVDIIIYVWSKYTNGFALALIGLMLYNITLHYNITLTELPVQVNGHKWGRNGEVINEGVELQHEPELVRGSDKLREKRGKDRTLFLIK